MPAPLTTKALASIASSLAQKGLDLLSGIFRGTGVQEIIQLIQDKTGIDINDAADNKLTDEQWKALKEFEFQHQDKLLETRQLQDTYSLELERLATADRENARKLQLEALKSEDPFVRRFIYYYAIGLTLLSFGFIFYASFVHNYQKEDDATRIIDTVLGFLLGVTLSAIIQFFFGSSTGSKSKEEKINKMSDKKNGEGVKL